MVLEGAEVEASVRWLPVRLVLLKDVAVLASIFCMLGSTRAALQLFVLDGAEVPEQQRVSA